MRFALISLLLRMKYVKSYNYYMEWPSKSDLANDFNQPLKCLKRLAIWSWAIRLEAVKQKLDNCSSIGRAVDATWHVSLMFPGATSCQVSKPEKINLMMYYCKIKLKLKDITSLLFCMNFVSHCFYLISLLGPLAVKYFRLQLFLNYLRKFFELSIHSQKMGH